MSWTTGQLYLRRDAMVQFGCHGRSWETRQSLSLKSRRCVECVASVLYPVLPCIDYQLLRFLWSRSDRFQGLCEVPPSCSLVSFRRCGLSHTSLGSWPLIVKSIKAYQVKWLEINGAFLTFPLLRYRYCHCLTWNQEFILVHGLGDLAVESDCPISIAYWEVFEINFFALFELSGRLLTEWVLDNVYLLIEPFNPMTLRDLGEELAGSSPTFGCCMEEPLRVRRLE